MASGRLSTQLLSFHALFLCTELNSNFTVIDETLNGPFHASGSRSPNHTYKLCRLTNDRAGRTAGSQNKIGPLEATKSIQRFLLTIRNE